MMKAASLVKRENKTGPANTIKNVSGCSCFSNATHLNSGVAKTRPENIVVGVNKELNL